MDIKKVEFEQFLFYGHFKSSFFKRERTSLLLDSELLWIRGYEDHEKTSRCQPDDFRMRYSDIISIEVVNNKKFSSPTIEIKGKLYKYDKTINIYIPYLENIDKAVLSVREAIKVTEHNQNERDKELKEPQNRIMHTCR